MRHTLLTLAVASLAVAAEQQGDGSNNDSDCQSAFRQCLLGSGSLYTCQCDLAQCTGITDGGVKQYCASNGGGQHASSSEVPPASQQYAPSSSSSYAVASSSSYAVPPSSSVAGAQGGQSGAVPVNAQPGTIGLGQACSSNEQCAGGAQCWGHTQNSQAQAGTQNSQAGAQASTQNSQIPRCGNTNAHCTTNAHCAFNTCNQGMCSGYLSGGGQSASSSRPMGVAPTGVVPGVLPNGTVPIVPYHGAAPVSGIMSGFAAIFFGVVAWVL